MMRKLNFFIMTINLNHLIKTVPSSPTLAMSEKSTALKNQGKDVINLSVGEPDIPLPKFVQDGAIKAIQDGKHLYTPIAGLLELRKEIAKSYFKKFQCHTESNVMVSCGAKQVIYNAFMISLEKDSEVIIPAPYWVSYTAIVTLAGGKSRIIMCDEQDDFKLTADALEAAITPHTRWLIINSPSNPSGAVYNAVELKALADVLLRHPHVWILSDDIYEHLVYAPACFVSILEVEPKLKDRVLLINGMSKSFSMTGWRIGYGVGPENFIANMTKLQSHSTAGACCIAQYGAISALSNPAAPEFLKEMSLIFQKRRDIFVKGLRSWTDARSPDGAFYVYANVVSIMDKKGVTSDIELANMLLEEALISCVPGTEFGLPGYLRFSYAADIKLLEAAVKRLDCWVC